MAERDGPGFRRPIRDQGLLDALDALDREPYVGTVWRSVRGGRDPLDCTRSRGRWDDGTLDVLYTSETRRTAIEERRFHLYQGQPIIPSRVSYELFELRVSLEAVMRFESLDDLKVLQLDIRNYGRLAYSNRSQEYLRSQEIAEACAFLGADGISVPSARVPESNNLVIFCERDTLIEKDIVHSHGVIDFRTDRS